MSNSLEKLREIDKRLDKLEAKRGLISPLVAAKNDRDPPWPSQKEALLCQTAQIQPFLSS